MALNIQAREDGAFRNPRTKQQIVEFFQRTIWPSVPPEILGKKLPKREREKILGYGAQGV